MINWKKCPVEDALKESKLAIEGIMAFLRVDFIIVYCIQHSKSQNLLNQILIKVLERIGEDLANLNYFVDKWSYLIVEKS